MLVAAWMALNSSNNVDKLLISDIGGPLDCPVCSEKMDHATYLVTKPDEKYYSCDHIFHERCSNLIIEQAKKDNRKPECPCCRREILAIREHSFVNAVLAEYQKLTSSNKQLKEDNRHIHREIEMLKEENIKSKKNIELMVQNQTQIELEKTAFEEKMLQVQNANEQLISNLKQKYSDSLRQYAEVVESKKQIESEYAALSSQFSEQKQLLSTLRHEKKILLEEKSTIEMDLKEASGKQFEIQKIFGERVELLQKEIEEQKNVTKKVQEILNQEKANGEALMKKYNDLKMSTSNPILQTHLDMSKPSQKVELHFFFLFTLHHKHPSNNN